MTGAAPALPDGEPRFRIAHLVRDPALRTALKTAEDCLGPIPSLPNDERATAGSDNAWSIIRRACLEAQVERARRELIDAQFSAVFHSLSGKRLDDFQALRKVAFDRAREAIDRVAWLPAMNRRQLDWKKHVIGQCWLRTDSAFRDAVARDEAYLATKAGARARAKCDRGARA
jgi:hypothetical protein